MRLIPLSASDSPLILLLTNAGTGWSDRALTSLLTQVREHLARGVGQAREDFVRGCIWGFVPHLPLHGWSVVF